MSEEGGRERERERERETQNLIRYRLPYNNRKGKPSKRFFSSFLIILKCFSLVFRPKIPKKLIFHSLRQ